MAKGVVPSQKAWQRVAATVRRVEHMPFGSQGAQRQTVFHNPFKRVRVAAAASGGGKYTGYLVGRPTAAIALTGNLADSDLGANGTAVVIMNAAEAGLATHDLTAGTPTQKTFLAVHIGISDETPAKPVYQINGFDPGDCE